jgi:hypothetical protein
VSIEIRLILAALAVYRLSQLVTIDDGPGDAFRRLRARYVTGFLGGLVHCPYCIGVWFAANAAIWVLWPSGIGDLALTWLGLAGAQAWMQGNREAGE